MKKLTKRQITKAQGIIENLNIAVKISLGSMVECWAKNDIEGDEQGRNYIAGAIWGTLDTLQMMGKITLKEYFLLKDYFDEKRWGKRDELRKEAA